MMGSSACVIAQLLLLHTQSQMCGSSICVVVCATLSHTEMKTNIIQLPNLATKKGKICNLNKKMKKTEAESEASTFSERAAGAVLNIWGF